MSPGSYVIPGQSDTGVTSPLNIDGLLIDWLTLRVPINGLGAQLVEYLQSCLGALTCVDSDGVVKWVKRQLDIEKLRSDSSGLFWTVQGDGKEDYLVVGGSPASLLHSHNVFGSLDIRVGANVLRKAAMKGLSAYLPEVDFWQCRRIDITGNYALPDQGSVKQALRALVNTDGSRRKASNGKNGGDTVYWALNSDLTKGKAYHKGPHLEQLSKKRDLKLHIEEIEMAYKLLRLEHTRGSRWFRRLEESGGKWLGLTAEKLTALYIEFFGPLVGGLEVKDMGREQIVSQIELSGGVSNQAALSAFNTYVNIKNYGYEEIKASMNKRTFFRHKKLLKAAGFSDGQLCAGNVIPLAQVRILVATPVTCWDDVRRVA